MPTNPATILISSAGRRGQLIECFRDAAKALDIPLRVVAADARPELSPACALADAAVSVPPCRDANFIPELLSVCRRENVRLVVPTIDTELPTLSEHRQSFSGAGIEVAVSTPEIVTLARDKGVTASRLAQAGISVPATSDASDYATGKVKLRWPVLIKPRDGSSSIGIVQPRSEVEAIITARESQKAIVQELWLGREYTVNVYFDRQGSLRCALPHWRIETRAGEVSKGRTEDVPVLRGAAIKLATCLPGARGALCFQAIVTNTGEYAIFEINARFGGGYPLAHRAGARFTQWLLEETLGLPSSASDNWKSGVTMLRYDTAIFRDE